MRILLHLSAKRINQELEYRLLIIANSVRHYAPSNHVQLGGNSVKEIIGDYERPINAAEYK